MDESSKGRRLGSRERWGLSLLGGALGAVIGPVGFWLRGLEATERLRERSGSTSGQSLPWTSAFGTIGTSLTQVAFMLLAFIATAALMPVLIGWLERRLDRPAGAFYARAAAAGIALGTGATILTTMGIFVTLLVVGAVHPDYATNQEGVGVTVGGLAAGTAVFAPIAGMVAPFLFLKWIVLFGVPFGLLFGLLVRRLARRR